MEVSARRSATLPNRTLCRRAAASSTDGRRQSRSGVSGALLLLWIRKSTAAFDQDLEQTTNDLRSPELVALFIQAPAQDPPDRETASVTGTLTIAEATAISTTASQPASSRQPPTVADTTAAAFQSPTI